MAKSKHSIGTKILLYINLLFCLAVVLSYCASGINPRSHYTISFLGLAYPVLLLCAFLFMVFWIIRKKWFFVFSLVSILLGWGIMLNNFGFRFSSDFTKTPGINSVRLMTYNVHEFKRYGAAKDISTKHEILALINEQQPDIVAFQEFYTRFKGQYEMRDSIVKIVGLQHFYFKAFSGNNDEARGMAIFSRYPIIKQGLLRLSYDTTSVNQCLFVDIKKDNKIFRVYSVHLQSINFEPQDYQYIDAVTQTGKPNFLSTKRLGSKLRTAFMIRSEQVFKVKDHAATCPYPYIIAGDFNDTPTSFAVNEMAKDLKNAFREKGSGFARTYNGAFPNYQIDYIMVSKQIDVASYKIVKRKLSDHYPLYSDLILK